jgi:hypothetical protein
LANINNWCDISSSKVGTHDLHQITVKAGRLADGVNEVAATIPDHYVAAHQLARVLRRRGKPQAAALIEARLPTSKKIRSGDLGEILGTAYVNEFTNYAIGIYRLQWKDHRDMAMHGDDLIGIAVDDHGRPLFLKGEAKSGAAMGTAVIESAREALASADERPTPHALLFMSEKYLAAGDEHTCDLIDDATLEGGIALNQVQHLIFTFTGNAAADLLTTDLQNYAGSVRQIAVNFRIQNHQEFIRIVFDTVIANAV